PLYRVCDMRRGETSMRILSLALGLAAVVPCVAAQQPAAPAAAGIDSLNNLTFRNIGPSVAGGRVTAAVGVPGQPGVYYVGAAAGGVFNSVAGGDSWAPGCPAQRT